MESDGVNTATFDIQTSFCRQCHYVVTGRLTGIDFFRHQAEIYRASQDFAWMESGKFPVA